MTRRIPAAEKQAAKAIKPLLAINQSRHTQKNDGKVHSVGTARQYESIYKGVANWLSTEHNERLRYITADHASQYLTQRSVDIQQKQLNNERRALELHLRHVQKEPALTLPRQRSEVPTIEHSRAYTPQQIELVRSEQSERMALSTELAGSAGLRAEELLSLRRIDERPPSGHRQWSAELYQGRETWHRYTVQGKGGLVREVRIPETLAHQLETRRLDNPERVTDRGVHHMRVYDVVGGKSFSTMFSRNATQHLGWSEGAHGLRHSYAQQRMDELQNSGQHYQEALSIVSQELGHFRPDITQVYLR